MKVLLLSKIGKLTFTEWKKISQAAVELEQLGYDVINYTHGDFSFEDKQLELVNQVSLLLLADALCLVDGYNTCNDALVIFALAIQMNLKIHAATGVNIPKQITFNTNL